MLTVWRFTATHARSPASRNLRFVGKFRVPKSKFQRISNAVAGLNVEAFQIGLSLMLELGNWTFRDVYRRGWLNILEMRSVEHCEHA